MVAEVDKGNTRSPAARFICHVSAGIYAKFPQEIWPQKSYCCMQESICEEY